MCRRPACRPVAASLPPLLDGLQQAFARIVQQVQHQLETALPSVVRVCRQGSAGGQSQACDQGAVRPVQLLLHVKTLHD